MNKRAQIWTADFIMGFSLFSIVLVISIFLIQNILPDEQYERLRKDGSNIAELLVNPGYPEEWNSSNVIVPGIADNNRINFTKLDRFDALNFTDTKNLLRTRNDYIFFFLNKTSIINITTCVHGYNISVNDSCHPQLDSITFTDLVKYERIVILNSSLVTLEIWVWNQ